MRRSYPRAWTVRDPQSSAWKLGVRPKANAGIRLNVAPTNERGRPRMRRNHGPDDGNPPSRRSKDVPETPLPGARQDARTILGRERVRSAEDHRDRLHLQARLLL